MRKKLKKIFENAVWWSGVVMVGLILGVSLQVVRAWTEPTQNPPGGNVGAPINTGGNQQWKGNIATGIGSLGLGGVLNVLAVKIRAGAQPGYVLTAQDANGQAAWAAGGGGGCYVDYSFPKGYVVNVGDSCGAVPGFGVKGTAGKWGSCTTCSQLCGTGSGTAQFLPPGGRCPSGWNFVEMGTAYVCCVGAALPKVRP